jgi:hypothetical protein
MRTATATLLLLALFAAPIAAKKKDGKIPPGHMPPPGMCRVWYDGRPPGHQPAPVSCREAEMIAARDRSARVIYGDDARRTAPNRDWRRDDGRAIPRRAPSGYPDRGRFNVAFDTGYNDGYEKGLQDARDNDRFDPTRDRRYRSADRGYDARYGSRDEYRNVYRDGFRSGYEAGYRDGGRDASGRRRLPF